MVRETKFYDLLSVSPSASEDEIRRAYKKKAVQMHPDKGGDENAFKELCHAYSVLIDADKRRMYDRGGADAVNEDGGHGGGMSAADLFGGLFGGGGRGGPRREPKPRDLVHQIDVPLESFYRGKVQKLAITRDRHCAPCGGSGASKPGMNATCSLCNGRGQRTVVQQIAPGFMTQSTQPCNQCGGRGSCIAEKDKCQTCRGKQVIETRDVFSINIEKGMSTGDKVTFTGQGTQVGGVPTAGDIVIVLKEKKHPVFTRHGKYLLIDHSMTLADALCGFEFVVPHMDGRTLHVKSQPGQVVKAGQLYSVHHEGMPVKGSGGFDKGDLLVRVNVVFPATLVPKTAAVVREVLGAGANRVVPTGDFYETHMTETRINIDDLAGKEDSDDDDDDPRGMPQATCAAA